MLRIKEIVESVKEEYLLNSLEETTSEVEILRTKKFLNETAAIAASVLMEADEDDLTFTQKHGKAIGAAGAAGVGMLYPNLYPAIGQDIGTAYQYLQPTLQAGYEGAMNGVANANEWAMSKLAGAGQLDPETITEPVGQAYDVTGDVANNTVDLVNNVT